MPGGDRTGPLGQGSRTGGAFGFCSGYNAPGSATGAGGGLRRSMGYRRGMGRGFREGRGSAFFNPGVGYPYPSAPVISKGVEIRLLKSQIESLDRSRKSIEKRLEEIGKE